MQAVYLLVMRILCRKTSRDLARDLGFLTRESLLRVDRPEDRLHAGRGRELWRVSLTNLV